MTMCPCLVTHWKCVSMQGSDGRAAKLAGRTRAETRWGWETATSAVLLCVGLTVVDGTEVPNDVGFLLIGLWTGYFVTACVWARRLHKSQRERPSA